MELNEQCIKALNLAKQYAKKTNSSYVGSEHLLYGLFMLKGSFASIVLEEVGFKLEDFEKYYFTYINYNKSESSELEITPRLSEILVDARMIATQCNSNNAGTEHLLLAIIGDFDSTATRILSSMNIALDNLHVEIMETIGYDIDEKVLANLQERNLEDEDILIKFSTDLTNLAKKNALDKVIGRDKEIDRMIQILSRKNKNNPCLIGEPGVGKTAIVNGLAIKISKGEVPGNLIDRKILSLDMASVVAGTKYRGEFEERMKMILDQVKKDPSIILFIDEIHNIIGAGSADRTMDAANILKPVLSEGTFRLIGATTTSEYRKFIEKDEALERRLQPVTIEEPTDVMTLDILKGLKKSYEKFHGITITNDALKACVDLSIRYINDRNLPDKAIDLLDEACAKSKFVSGDGEFGANYLLINDLKNQREEAIKDNNNELVKELTSKIEAENNKAVIDKSIKIDRSNIETIISQITNIPISSLEKSENEKLLSLEDELHKYIIGQDKAITAICNSIRRNRVGINDSTKPIGSFLFLGPTGVGKTEISKCLAKLLFYDEKALIRIDMSEYMEGFNVSKIIGAPPGYKGYDEGGQLTDKIRSKPYSVILFDEIEKAHPDVHNILLQLLDDGRLTDSQGRVVDFKNTIIIMTSNIGAVNIIEPKKLGFNISDDNEQDYKTMSDNINSELKKTFKPEFINRIDDIIIFNKLSDKELEKICALLLNNLKKSIKANKNISITFDKSIINYVLSFNETKQFGARPLKRIIQNKIEDFLAIKILKEEIKEKDKVKLIFDNELKVIEQ